MPNYIPPADKADAQTLTGAEWNLLKNALADYLNNGGIGNAQVSSNPAEKISNTKIETNPGAHASRHAPGGADEVGDIDILNTGTLLSVHASRHADGAADPLPALSISAAMLKPGILTSQAIVGRKDATSLSAALLGLTFNSQPMIGYNLNGAAGQPRGNGVVRGGKVYFCAPGYSPPAVVAIDFTQDPPTETVIQLTAGDSPRDLLLIGSNIYVLVQGTSLLKVRKIDINNVVTEFINLNDAAAPAPNDLDSGIGLVPNSDNTQMYAVAKRVAEGQYHVILRIPLTGAPASILKSDLGATINLSYPAFVKRLGTEYVVAIHGAAPGTETLYRRNATTLAAVDSITASTNEGRNRVVWDGNLLITLDAAGATLKAFDVLRSTMIEVARWAAPPGAIAAIDNAEVRGNGQFFDGHAAYFGVRNTASPRAVFYRVPVPGYSGGLSFQMQDATSTVNGFATDGQYLYIASSDAAARARITRMLM